VSYSYSNSTTLTGSTYGMTLTPATADKAPKTPAGLIVTQAVQTKDGWLGQVIVDKTIIWESPARAHGEDAIQAANERVVEAIRQLFQMVEAVEAAETSDQDLS
jgi:hypothetical protein